ncbi:hypothetical protein GcM1_190026, partial [Golovinomyces cichoracearum]
ILTPLSTQSVLISTPHEDPSIFQIPLQPNTSHTHITQLNPPTTNYSCNFSSDLIFFADQSQKHISQTPKHVPQTCKRSASAAPKNYKHFNKNVKVTKTVEATVKHCKCLCPEHDKIAKQNDEQSKKGWTNYFSNTNTKFKSSKEALFNARDNILDAYSLKSDRKSQEKILDFLNPFRQFTEMGQLPQTKPGPKSILFPARSFFAEYLNDKELSASSAESVLEIPSKHPTSPTIGTKTPLKATSPLEVDNFLVLVIIKGAEVPNYIPTQIRDAINRALGTTVISRVHTSPRNNVVLTCLNWTPEELLAQKSKWANIFSEWPI